MLKDALVELHAIAADNDVVQGLVDSIAGSKRGIIRD